MRVGIEDSLLTFVAEENIMVTTTAPQFKLHEPYEGHVIFRRNIYANQHGQFGGVNWPFIGEMFSIEKWMDSGMGEDERTTNYTIAGTASGKLIVADDAPFMDDQWRTIFKRLRQAGPREQATILPAYADWLHDEDVLKPVLMPVFVLDMPMLLDEKREVHKPRFEVEPGKPLKAKLRLTNRGQISVSDNVTIYFADSQHGQLAGNTETQVNIPTGQNTEIDFTITLTDQPDRVLLMAKIENDQGFRPTGLFLYPKV